MALLCSCVAGTMPIAAMAKGGDAPAPAPVVIPSPVVTPAPSLPSPVLPDGRPVRPEWGNISPFWGNISPFDGGTTPSSGTTTGSWGNISPFWGNISPFWGNISPFWGNISPFSGDVTASWGNISPFWGNISPFNGATTPAGGTAVVPLWGNISPFWNATGTQWNGLSTAWSNLGPQSTAADYAGVASTLSQSLASSESFWGGAVQSQSGRSFSAAFAAPLLAKYGIDLATPQTLGALSASTRQRFFFEWYDGLMNYAGRDHVDHWMGTVNWNPALTVQQGAGKRSVIGLLDFAVAGDADVLNNITKTAGISTYTTGHGAAVASLIVAAHDGKGVMGIAPMASVVAYNPFDSTGTAGWTDIANGLVNLNANKASIVNMSLGVPGMTLDQGWNGVFSDARLATAVKNTVYVSAAGNDGVSQTQDVAWNYAANPALIVVGSVDAAQGISSFSNRPGTACLTDGGICKAGGQLMNRFIVAPGELLLVSDDHGGVMRASGTSFAAPLVSGAIALLHNRWPWLAAKPAETASIILGSARDLGAPGVDPVYGVGLLDVTASQSPLSFDSLGWYSVDPKGKLKTQSASDVRRPNDLAKWQTDGKYFYAFETIGTTFRDFAIPLSTKLVGLTSATYDGSQQMFQSYLSGRLTDWIRSTPSNSGPGGGGDNFADRTGFASFAATAPVKLGEYSVRMSLAPRTPTPGFRQASSVPYQSSFLVQGPDQRISARVGYGDGAVALAGQSGLALASDYDSSFGGANPLLGMASGSGYANVDVALAPGLHVAAGVTQRHLVRDLQREAPTTRATLSRVADYHASAAHVSLAYDFSEAVTLRASYTRLHESSALLGIQSLDSNDFAGGSTTQGGTLAAEVHPGAGFTLAASATLGQSRTSEAAQFRTGGGGLVGSAFEAAITKAHVLDGNDRIRVSLSQPLYLERGTLDFTSVQVVDRQTGTLGTVTQSFEVSRPRRQLVSELLYARQLLGGRAEFDVFGRVQAHDDAAASGVSSVMAGGRVHVTF